MTLPPAAVDGFDRAWAALATIGLTSTGGYRRHSWTAVDSACRDWFAAEATARAMTVENDPNGNLWAWWGGPADGAVVTGSHLDSVPEGGAYDGALGVVSAFAAVDALAASGVAARRPVAVVAFVEEEGARFGVPCLGSRLMTGRLDAETASALADADGVTLAAAMAVAGRDTIGLGRDDVALARIGVFVELHVEQGRFLADRDAPIGIATAIWPHGRWRLSFRGAADHAGTARMPDRRDPMLPFAEAVLAARAAALEADAVATVGRVQVVPNATNAVADTVDAWLDCRAADEDTVRAMVAAVTAAAVEAGQRDRVAVDVVAESFSPAMTFDTALRTRVEKALVATGLAPPLLPTAAGHDAGVLAAEVPTAMLFVRNPTGASHTPAEHATRPDCLVGVAALATVLADLATGLTLP